VRLFPAELEIDDKEGFAPKKDIFKRKKVGDGLTNILTSVSQPCVIAVDGSWGSGKSVFLKMWAGELRKTAIPVIYFDAFKNDYFNDAFVAIVGEIISLATGKVSDKDSVKNLQTKAAKVLKIIALASTKKLIERVSLGVIDSAVLKDMQDATTENPEIEKQFEAILNSYGDNHSILESFKTTLSELPKIMVKDEESDKNKPLIIIIDELDRCRPDFALQILERIKHLFSVPNVHFVLGVHLNQLENSVSFTYGDRIDSHTYLQKFIHFTVSLSSQKSQHSRGDYSVFLDHIISQFDFNTGEEGFVQNAKHMILRAASSGTLSFRTIERILTKISIITKFAPKPEHQQHLIAGLCILKITNPNLYNNLKTGTSNFEEVKSALGLSLDSDRDNWARISKVWLHHVDFSFDDTKVENDIPFPFGTKDQRKERIPTIANEVIDRFFE